MEDHHPSFSLGHSQHSAVMVLPGKQPGLLAAVIVPAFLSTLVVIARFMRKVRRRPSYISRAGVLTAEILLILSVVSSLPFLILFPGIAELFPRSLAGYPGFLSSFRCTMDSVHIRMKHWPNPMECTTSYAQLSGKQPAIVSNNLITPYAVAETSSLQCRVLYALGSRTGLAL